MTVYTTVPLDDSNLDVTVTESADLVSIDIKPASFTGSGGGGGGAVSSVNAKIGIVVLDTDDIGEGTTNEYYTDARAQTLINTLPIAYTNADLTMSGNILPSIDSDGTTGYDLGSPTKKWKDLYLSEGSLYIDNQKVIESDSGTIVVRADVDQSLQTIVTGTGVLTLSSATTINVDSTLQMGPGKKITTSNGDPVEFGDKLNLDNNQIINVAAPTAAGHASTKGYVDTALFNLVNGAPTQLDTLGEIANSLGDDAAFSTTMTTALALKDTIVDVNTKDANTLSSANTYTDTSIAAIPATDLSAYSTTVQVEALPVSTFTNDAGYITSSTDSQTLSFANPNLTISNGNVVDLSSLTPTVPVTSVNTLIGAVVLDTDNINEGSTNLYHTTPRVQAVINTNTAGFLDASALTPYSTTVQTAAVIFNTPISTFTNDAGYSTTTGTVTPTSTDTFTNKSGAISQWTNDSGYTTATGDVTLTGTETLTNKTLTSPVLGGTTTSLTGNIVLDPASHIVEVKGGGTESGAIVLNCFVNSHGQTLKAQPHSESITNTMLLPKGASSTLVSEATVDGLVDTHLNTSSATTAQVLSWSGTDYDWVDGGGGSVALSDLTDVAELNLQNNDLLMYNSTASEWQNTNLGISVAPTLTGDSTIFGGQDYTLTVTNHATYDDPAYFCEIYDSNGTIVTLNSAFTDNLDGTITVPAPSTPGTNYEFRVRCQDFGDLQSEIGTLTFNVTQFGGTFRYWRIRNMLGFTGTNCGLYNMRFHTQPSLGGTAYPGLMTSDTTPAPYVVTKSYSYNNTTYGAWKAFNNVPSIPTQSGWWWMLSAPGGVPNQWLTIDIGASMLIESMTIGPWYSNAPNTVDLVASNTGAFTGEEVLITTIDIASAYPGATTPSNSKIVNLG